MSSVKEAPAEQMVFEVALEFPASLSQPAGAPGHIKLLSFYRIFVKTGSLFGQITLWCYEANSQGANKKTGGHGSLMDKMDQ